VPRAEDHGEDAKDKGDRKEDQKNGEHEPDDAEEKRRSSIPFRSAARCTGGGGSS
jgi:hypothetical protein